MVIYKANNQKSFEYGHSYVWQFFNLHMKYLLLWLVLFLD